MSRITVFTPTYNRAYCLHRCYESLQRQTCRDFEWLIIDDGSTDNTSQLVQRWIDAATDFPIRYVYKENGGMHTGYNLAYALITSELSINVDSDDYLTDTAIEDILTFWEENRREDIGGIYALDCYADGRITGTAFPEDLKSFKGWGHKKVFYESNGEKKCYVNRGDKKFIGVTRVIHQYPPIPVFPGEKYYSLYFKQHLIERDYTILILNRPVCVVEYLEDGSSRNIYHQYVRNPKGFCSERRFVMQYAPDLQTRMLAAIHYVAESMLANDRKFVTNSTNKPLTVAAIPVGIALYAWIRWRTRDAKAKN